MQKIQENYEDNGYGVYTGKIEFFITSEMASIDIDYPEDFRMAEYIAELKNRNQELPKEEFLEYVNQFLNTTKIYKTNMVRPSTIHCLALNYSGVGPSDNEDPLYFIKGSEAYATNGVIISYPKKVSRFWTEVELGIVISEDCENITEDEAIKYVEGFVVCGDISVIIFTQEIII